MSSGSTLVTLELHVDLYPVAAIESARASFAPFCDSSVERDGDHHRVTLRPRDGGSGERLRHEFGNYVLSVIRVASDPT